MAFFAVITPVYNREKLLPETIDTVLAQDFTDFEYILVDDKSTDGSLRVLQEYAAKDDRIRVVPHHTNQGRCIARNNGLSAATAEWICYLDSDDFYYPNHLSEMHRIIGENPGQLAVATEQTWGKKRKPYSRKKYAAEKVLFTFRDFIDANPISPNQLCHHRSVDVQWVPERLPISEDWLFHRQLALRTPILKYDVLTTDVRLHDDRSLSIAAPDTFVDWNLYAANRFIELEPRLPERQKHAVLSFTYLLMANVLLKHGKRARAASLLLKSLRYPRSWRSVLLWKGLLKMCLP